MKREFRVKKHEDFQRIIHEGEILKSTHFVCHYTLAARDFSKIGIAVGKNNGHAVTRVKIKRQVRAMLSEVMDFTINVDLVIVIRPKYSIDLFDEEKKELADLVAAIKEKTH